MLQQNRETLIVYFNGDTMEYFFSKFYFQSVPGFVPTSYLLPHEHAESGTIKTGEEVIKTYFQPEVRRIENPNHFHRV